MLYQLIKVYDRLKAIYKGVETITTWPYEDLQNKWVLRTTDQVLDWTFEARSRTGVALFCALPEPAQKIVLNQWFDPYQFNLNREGIGFWLIHHVFFDMYGDIVILHDHGKILWKVDDFDVDPHFEMLYGKEQHG